MKNLTIKNLHATVENKDILKGVSFEVPKGEVHVLMGPNGSGKSSLANIIMGNPSYKVEEGDVLLDEKSILGLEPFEIARKGLFMSFQNPLSIEGVTLFEFLKTSYNTLGEAKDKKFKPVKALEFRDLVRDKMKILDMSFDFLERDLNKELSGGEKKKSEVLQMLVLEPEFLIIDEIDSGLDIDALKVVAKGINGLIEKGVTALLITHYKRILDYIAPDQVHIIKDGSIVKSGGAKLVDEVEEEGFDAVG